MSDTKKDNYYKELGFRGEMGEG